MRRPAPKYTPDEEHNYEVSNQSATNWRFKWLERDMKALNERTDHVIDRLDKIDRRILIMGSIIIGLGIGSKLIDGSVLEILKKLVGL